MDDARIVQNQRISELPAAKQQQMSDLIEASKLPHTFANCCILQAASHNSVRIVFSDQFNPGMRPTPRVAIVMDMGTFRELVENGAKVLAQVDGAAKAPAV